MPPASRPRTLVIGLGLLLVAAAAAAIVVGAMTLGRTAARPTATPSPTASPTASPIPTPIPTEVPSPTPSPEPTPSLVAAPLDGRLVTKAEAQRHVIAVMIDDLSPARPQSGLASASVVWQAPAEGGIPRYMGLFQETTPGDVGPIRSSRYYFVVWASEWKAAYVHAGGSPQALATLQKYGSGQWVYNADEFRWGNRYFWRINTRTAPHNLYTDGQHLRQLAARINADDGPMKPAWLFAPDAPIDERPVGGRIITKYLHNTIRYDYDWRSNTYLRTVSVEGKQHDADTGQRIAPKNVVIMVVHFAPLGDNPHKGRLEANVVGSGTAWIATNGVTIKGIWRKKSTTAPTLFFDAKGQPVTLTIGQTFVQVMPSALDVSIKDGTVPPPPELPAPRSRSIAY